MWRSFAIAEGLCKTLSAILQKYVGVVMGTLEMGCVAAALIGAMQMVSGLSGWIWKSTRNREALQSLVPDLASVLCLVVLGFLAGIFGTALSIYTFTMGADMGMRTLFISASVVPASVAAAFLWPQTDWLDRRKVAGIGVFLLALWAMLGFPSVQGLVRLEAWVWVVLLLACGNAVGELLSRKMALKLDAWVNNFWIGTFTMLFSLSMLVGLGLQKGGITLALSSAFLVGTVTIGLVVVAMAAFRVWSYQGGGTIALKKIIVPGSYLVSAIVAGAVLYGEDITLGKVVGVGLWLCSVYLADSKAAEELKSIVTNRV